MIDIAANIAAVRRRIAAASARAGRDPSGVLLIGASKTKSAEMVGQALAAGIADIGENYVQEAAAKRAALAGAGRWHMIGRLQRNKVAKALQTFDVIHTIDSPELGAAVARHAAALGRPVRVLVEVNLGGEAAKGGIAPEGVTRLLEEVRDPRLLVEGLMTVPPLGPPERARPYFRRLRELRDQAGLRELSMGMTDDFEVAIEEGATMIRVGRAIFGER